LVALLQLLRRYVNKKVIVVVEGLEEKHAVKQFLTNRIDANVYSNTSSMSNDRARSRSSSSEYGDLELQALMCTINNANIDSFVFISTHSLFHTSLLPIQIEAIIVLSDNWVEPTNIRNCYNNSYPHYDSIFNDACLTVIRVVAKVLSIYVSIYYLLTNSQSTLILKGTFDEFVAKNGSFAHLKGQSLLDIHSTSIITPSGSPRSSSSKRSMSFTSTYHLHQNYSNQMSNNSPNSKSASNISTGGSTSIGVLSKSSPHRYLTILLSILLSI
jgi:hypothetical protein